jgi:hypothetical protein
MNAPDVDEARRNHVASGDTGRVRAFGRPARTHRRDAVAADREVTVVPGGARTVHDASILDDHVEGVAGSWRGCDPGAPGATGKDESQGGEDAEKCSHQDERAEGPTERVRPGEGTSKDGATASGSAPDVTGLLRRERGASIGAPQ